MMETCCCSRPEKKAETVMPKEGMMKRNMQVEGMKTPTQVMSRQLMAFDVASNFALNV